MVLGEPDCLEIKRFRQARLLDCVISDLLDGSVSIPLGHQAEKAKPHFPLRASLTA
jgi:hypothetical protein